MVVMFIGLSVSFELDDMLDDFWEGRISFMVVPLFHFGFVLRCFERV